MRALTWPVVLAVAGLLLTPSPRASGEWVDYPPSERFQPSGARTDFSILVRVAEIFDAISEVRPGWSSRFVTYPLNLNTQVFQDEAALMKALDDPEVPFVFKRPGTEKAGTRRNGLRRRGLSLSGLTIIELSRGAAIGPELVERYRSNGIEILESVRAAHPGDGAFVAVRHRAKDGPQTDACDGKGYLLYLTKVNDEWKLAWFDN